MCGNKDVLATMPRVEALAEHCSGLEKISLNGCWNITDKSVKVKGLAEHCSGLKFGQSFSTQLATRDAVAELGRISSSDAKALYE